MKKDQPMMFLSGDEAVARGAWEAGVHFASAYPGTPSTEILETLSTYPEVDSQWSVNEKTAYETAYGAAVGGMRSLFAAKHVGLNVAMDPFMISAYTGVNAGFVAVVADDPGLHSSQNEQDTRRAAPYAKVPLIEPSSPSETYRFIQESYAISEQFDIPVLFRISTRIAHTKENVTVGARVEVPRKALETNIEKYVMIPKHAYPRHLDLEKRLERLKAYSEKTPMNRIVPGKKDLGIITSGVAALYAREMFPDASFLVLGMPYPFPSELVKKFVKSVRTAWVVEELEPFLEEQCLIHGIKVKGKKPSWRVGELNPKAVVEIIKGKEKLDDRVPGRRPVLCPGCPHRSAFTILRKLKCVVAGDIGCYTLGALAPLGALHTQTCMGSSIPFFEGFQKNTGRPVVAVIGDSTFVHTGVPGLINAAYNGAKGVVLILDNATTAMTGAQPNPATGVTIKGLPTKKLILEDLCRAAGADSVDVVDALDSKLLESTLKARLGEKKLSVVIARSPCRLIERSRKQAPVLDLEKCTHCNFCLSIDCPALKKGADGNIEIDEVICTGCDVCVRICPPRALESHEEK